MAESADKVQDFVLNNLRREDMRPREEFRIGDPVQVIGRGVCGKIEKFDADHRLAWLGNGWWYLKDLEKIRDISRKGAKPARETFTQDGLNYLKGTAVFFEGKAILFQPALDTRLPEFVS
ncbi:MAG: hypothetical protein CVU42_13765 [Chloroflexi bacterium HGW-Chloroflexi-4]|jgi:hypothetical protein|nr:MAG: hypothetical protein CVU42_13765 [Chloroflexi bacterium HGW-Chloroflexi-4]